MSKFKERTKKILKVFSEKMKHAFAIEKRSEFTKEETEILDKIAQGVVKRRLTSAAVLFLESFKPMNFIGSQAIQFFLPIAEMILPVGKLEKLPQIFEKRDSIELLLKKIEQYEEIYNKEKKKK